MSLMIDRVAKAMWIQRRKFAASKGIHLEEWSDGWPEENGILEEARAAIEEMHEPTVEMIDAVGSDYGPALDDNWKAMIDGALKRSPPAA